MNLLEFSNVASSLKDKKLLYFQESLNSHNTSARLLR